MKINMTISEIMDIIDYLEYLEVKVYSQDECVRSDIDKLINKLKCISL